MLKAAPQISAAPLLHLQSCTLHATVSVRTSAARALSFPRPPRWPPFPRPPSFPPPRCCCGSARRGLIIGVSSRCREPPRSPFQPVPRSRLRSPPPIVPPRLSPTVRPRSPISGRPISGRPSEPPRLSPMVRPRSARSSVLPMVPPRPSPMLRGRSSRLVFHDPLPRRSSPRESRPSFRPASLRPRSGTVYGVRWVVPLRPASYRPRSLLPLRPASYRPRSLLPLRPASYRPRSVAAPTRVIAPAVVPAVAPTKPRVAVHTWIPVDVAIDHATTDHVAVDVHAAIARIHIDVRELINGRDRARQPPA